MKIKNYRMKRLEHISHIGHIKAESWYYTRQEAVEDAKAMGYSLNEVTIEKM